MRVRIPLPLPNRISLVATDKAKAEIGSVVSRYCGNSETESMMGSAWLTKTSIFASCWNRQTETAQTRWLRRPGSSPGEATILRANGGNGILVALRMLCPRGLSVRIALRPPSLLVWRNGSRACLRSKSFGVGVRIPLPAPSLRR